MNVGNDDTTTTTDDTMDSTTTTTLAPGCVFDDNGIYVIILSGDYYPNGCLGAIYCDYKNNIVYGDCSYGLIWNNDTNGCTCPDEDHCPEYIDKIDGPCSSSKIC